jgi:adenylate kinase family enzyme
MNIRLFLLGMPGSGKGTVSELLLSKLNNSSVRYYNVGGILREQAEKDKHIKETHAAGGLVTSDRVLGIFEDALSQESFVADGSPRRPEESEFILSHPKWTANPGLLIHLKISPELAKERLMSRGRFDDTEVTIQKRFDDYQLHTLKSVENFAKHKQLVEVDASVRPEAVCESILLALGMK